VFHRAFDDEVVAHTNFFYMKPQSGGGCPYHLKG
jgi:hypothetical protein